MSWICDLHMHSQASDGQYEPANLVKLVKDNGIDVMALTDHDSISGVREAMDTGEALGLRVISGIEMSAREFKTFHLLGYGIDIGNKVFQEQAAGLQSGRDERGKRITAYLHEKGIPISYDEVVELAHGGTIGRPHFARVILRHGWCATWEEVFNCYLDTDEFHLNIEDKPPIKECMEKIKAAGGKTSLAHPCQIGIDDAALDLLVGQLKEIGLDAIECYYPKHTLEQTAFYHSLTEKYNLHVTGGSDFHGEKVKPEIKLSAIRLELDWLLET